MTIGVDGGAVSVRDERLKVGVYQITSQLLENLTHLDSNYNYRIYKYEAGEWFCGGQTGKLEQVTLPRLGFNEIQIPLEIRRRPVRVYLGISQIFPGFRLTSIFMKTQRQFSLTPVRRDLLLRQTVMIGFIYDLCFLYHPDAYPESYRKLKAQTENLVRRSSRTVTILHASKKDIENQYGFPGDRIHVIYPGIGVPAAKNRTEKPSDPYFLFVGALKRSKNIPLLLRAFAEFVKAGSGKHKLLLAGGDYWPDERIGPELKDKTLAGRVELLGHVPDEKLALLYRGATALVSPSLREGFCLPAAEALASGCPVIGATTGAFPEVVGEAGILVTPGDTAGLVRALKTMAKPAERARYFGAIKNSRLDRFSWQAFARGVTEVIKNTCYEKN